MEGETNRVIAFHEDREPAFDAIIPAPVRYNETLSANAKLLYGEIRALSGTYGYCFAANRYFAKLYGMTERSIARFIAQLESLRFIQVTICRDDHGRVNGRRIYIGCGFPEAENDSLIHMTKLSAPCQNCQGEGDKIVSQSLNNNINNNIYARARKTTDIAAVKAELQQWVDGLSLPEQDAEELTARLSDFADFRKEKGKPMSVGRCVTTLVNRLQRYSNGNVAVMTAMLDNAIFRRWDSVYQLREDELRDILGNNGTPAAREDDIKWL